MSAISKPVFGQFEDQAADLLSNAAAVTCFLSEVAIGMGGRVAETGLSDDGVFGFTMILQNLENTIKLAGSKL